MPFSRRHFFALSAVAALTACTRPRRNSGKGDGQKLRINAIPDQNPNAIIVGQRDVDARFTSTSGRLMPSASS